jgi:nitrous oxidase accessory protein
MLLALGLAGCPAGSRPAAPRPWAAAPPPLPERPAACRSVSPGSELTPVLASAKPGDAFCLAPGEYRGPLRLGTGVAVWGPRSAVVRSSGDGTTVRLEGDRAALLGVTVDGSGGRYDLLDAAVHVGAQDARVEGVRIVHAVFGILVEKSRRALLRGNEITGDPYQALGLRGDGIRLWETYDSRIEANRVMDSRDVVVWYSSGNHIVGNRIERGRYGTHLMYSHRNQIAENAYVGNVTGIFLMYSRDVTVSDNLIAEAAGAAGFGLGLKESGNLQVVGNRFLADTVGVYADTSPLYLQDRNLFEANVFRYDQVGVIFHSSEDRNAFRANDFRDNGVAVRVEGRGDALRVTWAGNYFDDYAGYDLDGDGVGDVPYELRSLSSDLVAERAALAFYRGTPALGLVETIGRVVPLFTPRLLLVDPSPRMAPVAEASLAD